MGSAAMKKLEGFEAMGSEVPFMDPDALVIVGLDVPETPQNWFAHCARLKDITDEDLVEYAESMIAAGRVDHVVKAYRDGDKCVDLDGRSTTRAARIARKLQAERRVKIADRLTVRVQIFKGPPEELARINLDSHKHRPLTRGQQAKGALVVYNHFGEDVKKTAAFLRVDPATVKNLLGYFDLSEKAQREIDRGDLPASASKKLAKMPRERQDAAVDQAKAAGAVKGNALDAALDKVAKGEVVVAGEKAPRARSRKFLERWRDGLRAEKYQELARVVDFILGGPVPKEFCDDTHRKILEAAGYKD